MKVAFAGVFAGQVADRVRARLRIPCEVVLVDDREIVGDVDVLVSMAFTPEMAAAAPRLRLVQVPGAGLDRIDRAALAPGTALANAYGHDVGIAEYVIGAMLAVPGPSAGSTPTCARGDGTACGRARRCRSGRSWRARPWASWATAASARRSPGGRWPSTWTCWRSGATRAGPIRTARVPTRPGSTRRGAGARRLPGHHARAHARHPRAHRRAGARADEAHRGAGQRGARRGGGQGRALRRAPPGAIAGAALDVWYRYPTGAAPVHPGHRPFHELPNVLMTPTCRAGRKA